MKKIWEYIKRLFGPRTTAVTVNLSTIEADSIVLRNGEHSVKIEVNDKGLLLIHGDLAVTGRITYFYTDEEIKK